MRKIRGKVGSASDARRVRRRLVIRKTVVGDGSRPRICVTKSNKHLTVQVIDDVQSKTIFSVQTFGEKAVAGAGNNIEGAKKVGAVVAENLKKHSLKTAVFDRAGYRYHGVVAAIAQTIRESGINI